MALRTVKHHMDPSIQSLPRSAALDLGGKKLVEMVAATRNIVCARCYHEFARTMTGHEDGGVASFWREQCAKIESLSPEDVARVFRDWVASQVNGLNGPMLKTFIMGMTRQVMETDKATVVS